MYLLIALIALYLTGLTVTVYGMALTGHWRSSCYDEDEQILFALIWPFSVSLYGFYLLMRMIITAPAELGKRHRDDKGKKK